jgi:adenylate kinase
VRPDAILLIGPTGSGKTPLGELLGRKGLWGRSCAHFDFGAQLRQAVAQARSALLGPDDLDFLRKVLHEGALLEDEHFHIARRLLAHFLETNGETDRDPLSTIHYPLIILNGLPRHIGQAHDVDDVVNITALVHLNCPAKVIHDRVRTNAGGDRHGRTDDHPEHVTRKHRLFEQRTRPLLDHYRTAGARIIEIDVTPITTPADIHALLIQAGSS